MVSTIVLVTKIIRTIIITGIFIAIDREGGREGDSYKCIIN